MDCYCEMNEYYFEVDCAENCRLVVTLDFLCSVLDSCLDVCCAVLTAF